LLIAHSSKLIGNRKTADSSRLTGIQLIAREYKTIKLIAQSNIAYRKRVHRKNAHSCKLSANSRQFEENQSL
jgi:hypothetical protein